ncbi:MAG: hypothetical protein PHH93_05070 [Prolixibacteraceae bacterium]|nr:hypothetical protein [Prolixibacteraceae bacterium]
MLQEIITYIIIAVAVFTALWKIVKKLQKKRKKDLSACIEKKGSMPADCFNCTTECALRQEIKKENR